mmetsp:Transcript_7232/g.8992  ORF Transcript_7232/g.8992 Transcript_7232/m.8992 type:complete len:348 (+) Transcript_7232:52-1095(+)
MFNAGKAFVNYNISKRLFSTNFKVALEWTPNTNHIGFYVARANGYYNDSGLSIDLISPEIDNYSKTPGRQAIAGSVQFAMGPTETAISSATTEPDKMRLLAVAALLQKDTSAIVTLKESGIDTLNKIKSYASYEGRFEMSIVHEMIKQSGGNPANLEELTPAKLQIWPNMTNKLSKADATWIFLNWEGIEAEMNQIKLNIFKLEDYNIPYGYTPILLGRQDILTNNEDSVKSFIAATKKGYEYANNLSKVDECVDILLEDSKSKALKSTGKEQIKKSLTYLINNNCYLNNNNEWGKMDLNVWNKFLDWMCNKNIITQRDGTIITRNDINVEELIWMKDCVISNTNLK